MARYVIRSLGSLLSDAQERGLINRNPVHDLRSRRKGRNRKADGEDRRGNRLVIGTDIPTPMKSNALSALPRAAGVLSC